MYIDYDVFGCSRLLHSSLARKALYTPAQVASGNDLSEHNAVLVGHIFTPRLIVLSFLYPAKLSYGASSTHHCVRALL